MIWDEHLFDSLVADAPRILLRELDLLTTIIERCCAIKADVVSRDEREEGVRAILNYGHTTGHAMEAAAGYSGITHGEAISVGMGVAARLGRALELTPPAAVDRQDQLLAALGLPLRSPLSLDPDRVVEHIAHDKKSRGGEVAWVLLEAVGKASPGHAVPAELVNGAVRAALAA